MLDILDIEPNICSSTHSVLDVLDMLTQQLMEHMKCAWHKSLHEINL